MPFSGFRRARPLSRAERAMLADGELANAVRRERARNGYRVMQRPLPAHLAENEARDAAIIQTRGRVLWDESLHPRWPAGTWAGKGGEFRPKGAGDRRAADDDAARAEGDAAFDDGGIILASTGGRGGKKSTPPPREIAAEPKAAETKPTEPTATDGPSDSESSPKGKQEASDTSSSSSDVPAKSPEDKSGWQFAKKTIRWIQSALGVVAFKDPRVSTLLRAIEAGESFWEDYGPSIRSSFDPPRSLAELQAAVADPAPGYEIHHIVEKRPAWKDGIGREITEAPRNLVRIPVFQHELISIWYSTKSIEYPDAFGNPQSPREFLRGKSFEERYAFGIKTLQRFGVLKP